MKKNTLVAIVVGGLVLLIGLIVLLIRSAPIFSFFFLTTVVLSIAFMMTEDWLSHNAIEYENRFWSAMAFVLACSVLLCPDSPLHLHDFWLASLIIVLFTYFAHLADRYLRNIVLNRIPNLLKRVRSADFDSLEERMQAHTKVKLIDQYMKSIDNPWISSTFMNLFAFPFVVKCERDIITVFRSANQRELNFIVQTVSLARIMYKVKDHKIFRSFNRTEMLELLAVKRIKELTSVSKAYLLHGFQNMKLSAHPNSEQYVKSIIMSTALSELSELKSLTDSKGDVNSMHKLLYTDIREKKIKQDVLNYIAAQARIQEAHKLIGSKKGKASENRPWRKIVSDIDDTLMCSGGSWPAGIDPSYPKHTLYPGVLAFYRELDLGVTGADEWDDNTLLGNLVFLSARPHVYKSLSEDETYSKFRALKVNRGFYTSPTLLAGGLDSGTKFVLGGSPEPISLKKFEKFSEYLTMYPEYKYVFIGDNGQGDARTVEMLLDNKLYRDNLDRAYIHEVQPVRFTYAKKTVTRSSYCSNIYYFRNYVDAALDAYGRNLIRLSGLRRIMVEAVHDFELIQWQNPKQHHDKPTAAVTTVNTSSSSASTKKFADIASKTQSAPIDLNVDSLGKRKLTTGGASAAPGVALQKQVKLDAELQKKRDAKMRDLNTFLRKGNLVLGKKGLADVPLLKFTAQHHVGDVVKTPYGRAIVIRFRPLDGMYEVLLQWDNTGSSAPVKAVLQSSSVVGVPQPLPPKTMSSGSSKSMFRSRSLVAVNLAQHVKSVAFIPPVSVKPGLKNTSSSKSAVIAAAKPALASEVFGVDGKASESFSSGKARILVDAVRQCHDFTSSLPKPIDWVPICIKASMEHLKTDISAKLLAISKPEDSSIPNVSVAMTSEIAGLPEPIPIKRPLLLAGEEPLQNLYGALVWTQWGIGWIVEYRESDDMLQVFVNFGHQKSNVGPACWLVDWIRYVANNSGAGFLVAGPTNHPCTPPVSRPFFAKCFVSRLSVVQLTDPLLTESFQEVLSSHYGHQQLLAAFSKMEDRLRVQENKQFSLQDKPVENDRLSGAVTPVSSVTSLEKSEISTSSPSRLATAALTTMRALGILRPAATSIAPTTATTLDSKSVFEEPIVGMTSTNSATALPGSINTNVEVALIDAIEASDAAPAVTQVIETNFTAEGSAVETVTVGTNSVGILIDSRVLCDNPAVALVDDSARGDTTAVPEIRSNDVDASTKSIVVCSSNFDLVSNASGQFDPAIDMTNSLNNEVAEVCSPSASEECNETFNQINERR